MVTSYRSVFIFLTHFNAKRSDRLWIAPALERRRTQNPKNVFFVSRDKKSLKKISRLADPFSKVFLRLLTGSETCSLPLPIEIQSVLGRRALRLRLLSARRFKPKRRAESVEGVRDSNARAGAAFCDSVETPGEQDIFRIRI
jgi:hypothetical protein